MTWEDRLTSQEQGGPTDEAVMALKDAGNAGKSRRDRAMLKYVLVMSITDPRHGG